MSNSKYKFIIVFIPYRMCVCVCARARARAHTHARLPRSYVIRRDLFQAHSVMCVVSGAVAYLLTVI